MESDLEGSDSVSEVLEDHVSISLLPEQKHLRRKRHLSSNFAFKLRNMFGGKTAIFGITVLLLLLVLLIAVFARPSSSTETNAKDTHQSFDLPRDTSAAPKRQIHIPSPSLRLPRHLSPIEYLVYLHPNLTTFKFSGKVDVLLYCSVSANNISLHVGDKIKVPENGVKVASIQDLNTKETVKLLDVASVDRTQGEMLVITLQENSLLQSGGYYFLVIEFSSVLRSELSGFYLSTYYTSSGEKRYLATTHFEPTEARNAFPCFDEPALKARFSIVIVREKRHVALANMPLNHTDGCGERDNLCIDHFQKSVEMSTYLVAFVVCDFARIESQTLKGIKVRVWAPPEQIDQGTFALSEAVKVLEFYEETFKVDYPLPKQDLIAIPDFATGAMENWGLITFRLTSILFDANKSSPSNKQWVAVVVAHELAHQWFGNLVTMKWWNDLWLNEGFASFMESIGVNSTNPEWKMMDQFYLDKFQKSMALDQLSNSHPIMAEVKDPEQINSLFDSISYDKGASIIRMLEDVLGTDVFFKGLQQYLKQYSFSNAETNDLWDSLTQAAGKQGINVKQMMTTWTDQMGFPVVTVKRDFVNPSLVHVEQHHFLIHPDSQSKSHDTSSWIIPLTYVTQDHNGRHTVIMEVQKGQFELPYGTSHASWIKMNSGQTGYYRINYDALNWCKLGHQLDTHHEALSAANRAGLIDDALNLARAGWLHDDQAMDITPYLKNEKEYVPWMSALSSFAYFATQFSTLDSVKKTDSYTSYKKYIYYLINTLSDELGWKENTSDGHLRRYLRASVMVLAAEYEDVVPVDEQQGFKSQALALFNAWLKQNQSIAPNLRNAIYSIGIKDADDQTWNEVFHRYQTESVPSEKRKLMYALTCSRNQDILKRLLTYSLQDDKVRSQDSVSVIDSVALNPEGRVMAWEFVKENYNELFTRYGKGSFDFSRLITSTTAHFNTEEKRNDVKTFFDKVDRGSGDRAVQQSLESINANIKWIAQHQPKVLSWIERFLSNKDAHVKRRPCYDNMSSMREKYGRP
ncbi:endoplasmic reticulum aminopeptidase 1-like isoform X2 [Montipora foliosa]|uniref:endoplasmic reticulum aminopeptidase 1-like isoform X2 n=1 Tax=Montipora foliosa TaxID=591990 RepID=UPI0035F19659